MITVFLQPVGLFSRAMVRVANALAQYAPDNVQIVTSDPHHADLRILHVISGDFYQGIDQNQPHAIIQYCLTTALDYPIHRWQNNWQHAKLVWSYYDLVKHGGGSLFEFYHAPLGVDETIQHVEMPQRDILVMTSGYVSSELGEAIEEVAFAVSASGGTTLHLGPQYVEGMRTRPPGWKAVSNITDQELSAYYSRSEWVSGLRHGEGFELPVLEGLVCGARPIVFDRPDMTQWYEGHAAFVPECAGDELVERLTELFHYHPKPVTMAERAAIRRRFDWETIARGFWERLV